ncbi:MAG: rhomboid family intramembrane serine protease [Verrucomicrobia bacterium]|nr:rhomboid family intramembrane serine protease [Verrucomicrobiota bacterium]
MRHIGTLIYEKDALRLASYLRRQGIQNTCEIVYEEPGSRISYEIWVHEEDRIEEAKAIFETFQKDPANREFDVPITEQLQEEEKASLEEPLAEEIPLERRLSAHFTNFIIAVCALIFFINGMQEIPLVEEGISEEIFSMTPIQADLLFDLPPFFEELSNLIQKHQIAPNQNLEKLSPEIQADLEALPHVTYWRGLYDWILLKFKTGNTAEAEGPLFIKLRQGEVWRLFSPCLLHAGLLHILFNMIWVWVLGRPIEQRIGLFKTLLLSLVIGIGSNATQYFMGGPFFIGYSGVVMGLAGFIWSREQIAPWEGYPVNRSTLLFLVLFVLAMFGLQATSFILQLFSDVSFSPNIANSAHIAGGVFGLILGRSSFFSWRAAK